MPEECHRRLRACLIVNPFRVLNRQTVLRVNQFFNFDGFMADQATLTSPQDVCQTCAPIRGRCA